MDPIGLTPGFSDPTPGFSLPAPGAERPLDEGARRRLDDALSRFAPEIASNWFNSLDRDTRERFPELDRYLRSLVAGLQRVTASQDWSFTQSIIDGLAEQRAGTGYTIEQTFQRALLAGRRAVKPFYVDDDRGSTDELLLDLLHECVFRFTESFQGMRMASESERMHLRIIKSLVMALEARDAYTKGHSISVALIAKKIAEEIGDGLDASRVHLAGVLHDVGKVGIPDNILLKEDSLDPHEWEILKTHTVTGVKILKPINMFPEVVDGTLYHHENWDGSGYPKGLAGNAIPLVARILRVADTFDAMTTTRVYRPSLTVDEAVDHIRGSAGRLYDPDVVEAFARIVADPGAMRDLSMASLVIDMREF